MGIVVKKSSETGFSEGWHEVTIDNAVVGDYNDSRYIDLHFDGYPESLKCRVWEARNQEGEEFSIANMVRYSNPDILEELSTDGQLSANLDDSPAGLKGKKLQALFFKKDNGYTEVFQKTAPAAPFENIIDNFTEETILKIKTSAEAYKAKRDAKASETTVNSEATASETAAY